LAKRIPPRALSAETPMDKRSLVHLLLIFAMIAFMALLASLIR
jgi:hypothetical protein